jgi:hypothetical protein
LPWEIAALSRALPPSTLPFGWSAPTTTNSPARA